MLDIYTKGLDVENIFNGWYEKMKDKNCGAFVSFTGIVRAEDGIEALSFDIHKGMLKDWFEPWEEKLKKQNAYLLMAHSEGDVMVSQTSFMCAVVSPKRRVGLEMLDEFVEDFKANAPIWKYDIKEGKRLYAKSRSHKLSHAGLLGE